MLLQLKVSDVFVPKADSDKRKAALDKFDKASLSFKDDIALLSI